MNPIHYFTIILLGCSNSDLNFRMVYKNPEYLAANISRATHDPDAKFLSRIRITFRQYVYLDSYYFRT